MSKKKLRHFTSLGSVAEFSSRDVWLLANFLVDLCRADVEHLLQEPSEFLRIRKAGLTLMEYIQEQHSDKAHTLAPVKEPPFRIRAKPFEPPLS